MTRIHTFGHRDLHLGKPDESPFLTEKKVLSRMERSQYLEEYIF
jgi:hypothetical protein